ncbi:MAG: hypothetical protein SVX43_23535, partial [Cyanobacteriota bacterium]|nr:hypothetical protein [Cyanobacteriota bacterium]
LQSTFASLPTVESLADGGIAFQLMQQAKEFYVNGDYPKAANLLEQAVASIEKRSPHPQETQLLGEKRKSIATGDRGKIEKLKSSRSPHSPELKKGR